MNVDLTHFTLPQQEFIQRALYLSQHVKEGHVPVIGHFNPTTHQLHLNGDNMEFSVIELEHLPDFDTTVFKPKGTCYDLRISPLHHNYAYFRTL